MYAANCSGVPPVVSAPMSANFFITSGCAITRAVGGDATLLLDIYRDRVNPGDRFLLCSDGLTRTLSEARIQEWMAHEQINATVQGLIAATLEAGAPDNVTVVIVEAYS